MLRILWSSNTPFAPTGYGTQTATAARRLTKMGHEVAIFAFYGLQGTKIDWQGIPIYPNNPKDWGQTDSPMFYEDIQADVFITLVDAWVMKNLDVRMNWVPWMPVDHDPIPQFVVNTLKEAAGLVRPIAMSRFGQQQLKNNGIESYYIPHSIDTTQFLPDPELRQVNRDKFTWKDKFVVGTVGTNHSERKNWVTSMRAMQKFSKNHPGEIIYYCHTDPVDDRGVNLAALRKELDIESVAYFPPRVMLTSGVSVETMCHVYNTMDVFLLPSKGEGFGIPIMEAQSCGIPVIITKCTGQEELMGGGWFIEKLTPTWTGQASWQFECTMEEVLERLEQAYQAKKDGSIEKLQKQARKKALEYDDNLVYGELWPEVLRDIEKRIHAPKNLEGVQQGRLGLIPRTCIPRKVLDIGCGVTQPYRTALEHLGEYVGIDTKNGPGVVRMDAHKMTYKDNEFGFVWCSEMLEHAKNPAKVVAEAKRVGKHGVIIFSTPANQFFKMDPEHKVVKDVEYTTLASGDGLICW
ncbi:hypothetical protein LCGC14_1436070 [marine sediment metagenome]|uniref:Methyltransferase type 11 domain-containing protein n=1 Tax=marine sediment metagenome TaxID=412755 RepID=A0A0F9MP09_9ZZZZ